MGRIKSKKWQKGMIIFGGLGLVIGFVGGYLVGMRRVWRTTPAVDRGQWLGSSLHFRFDYPWGWHVFSDGERFLLDDKPIYLFPHQPYRVVEGEVVEEADGEIARLTGEGYRKVLVPVSEELNGESDCYENSTKKAPRGPFPTLDGQLVCLVTVPWGELEQITYMFKGNNTNVDENRTVYLKFIQSIRPVGSGVFGEAD